MARGSQKRNSYPSNEIQDLHMQKRVSEIDLMKTLMKFRRRVERQWAEQVRSLMQIYDPFSIAPGRALQRLFDNDRVLIPAPVRVVNRRR
jgi:hypothetical protein